MGGLIPGDKIEEIKNRADIVAIVSEYLTLRRAGRNLLGLCPFHQEKTPSFTVSPDKQIFYCFGCGAGGDLFTFLMKISGMSYPEAIRYLAGKMGIAIPEADRSGRQNRQAGVREQIFRINQLAAEYFSKNLYSDDGKAAREYLKQRGIEDETAMRFSLGYASPGWNVLRDYFRRKGMPLELVSQAGLIIPKNDDYYDRFRGRLIFPIQNNAGGVVAFGGRSLDDSTPKYLNSPETPVYTKGKNLYGLYLNRDRIRGLDQVILAEGYFDLLSLWSAGMENSVATLGTALTADQVDLIRRFTRNVVVLFDSDEAGQKAMRRSLELFLPAGMQAKVVVLSDGHDPDSFIRAFGREKISAVIENAYSLVDYFIEEVIGKAGSFEDMRDVTRDAVSLMTRIENPLERELFIKRVSERLAIDHDSLKREIGLATRPREDKPPAAARRPKKSLDDSLEVGLLHLLLEYPERIPASCEVGLFKCFLDEETRGLGDILWQAYAEQGPGNFNSSVVLNGLTEGPLRARLLRMMIEPFPYGRDVLDRVLEDLGKQLHRRWFRHRQQLLQGELSQAETRGDRDGCRRILEEKNRLLMEERGF